MRRTFTLLLLALIILNILSGCVQPFDVELDVSGERFLYSCRMYGKIIRYDVVDKKAVLACPDPLCKHRKDCPVTNVFTAYVSDNYIMYGKLYNGLLGGYTILCYDLKAGKISKVLECPEYQEIAFINESAYFSASHVEYNDDGSPKGQVWDVYKYTMSSNDLIKLNEEGLMGPISVADYTEDKIVWFKFQNVSGDGYFSTDYNFKNQSAERNDWILGNYAYDFIFDHNSDSSFLMNIQREEITTGKVENVITGALSYRLDNINNPKGIVYNTHHNDDGRSIYYTNLSDLDTKIIGTIPEGYSLTGEALFPNFGTTLYINGYIGVYVKKDTADHSEEHNGNTMFFVNIKNGDNFILAP